MKLKAKSLLSLTIALLTVISVVVTSVAMTFADTVDLPFTDVPQDKWYYDSVKYVFDNDIMNGTSPTRFEPDSTLSRAMAVTIMYRVAGEPSVEGLQHPFSDVPSGKWYSDAVLWGYDSKIVNGREATRFVPGSDIKREEFAAILARYAADADLVLPEKRSGDPADADEVSEYAKDSVRMLYRAEIILGRNGNIFDPEANITRAEAAAMIERFMENAEEKKPEETDPPVTEPEETDPPVTEPEETDPPVTEPEETDPPVTEPEETDPPVTEPEETDPPVTEPEETDPPVTEPEETDPPVVDPDEVITVTFVGNSFTTTGSTPWYFQALAEDENRPVEVYNLSHDGYVSYQTAEWIKANADKGQFKKAIEETDILIIQDAGYFPQVGYDKGLADILGPGTVYSNPDSKNGVDELRKIFGYDKPCYAIMPFIAPVNDGLEMGVLEGNRVAFTNAQLIAVKERFAELDISLVYVGSIYPFNSNFNKDDFIVPGDVLGHPTDLLGYGIALAMYCTIFDENPTDQSSEGLWPDDIPGNTKAEKDEYMRIYKETVKLILDTQNSMKFDPPETKPEETDPPETKPEETDPPETKPEETDPPETKPEETDPPETKPEETDPPETEPEETDPKEIKNVIFLGNSMTVIGGVADHFEVIAEDRSIKATDLSVFGYTLLQNYYKVSGELRDPNSNYYNTIVNADAVVLQELGCGFPEISDERLAELTEGYAGISGNNTTERIMDLIGRDKKYYSYMGNAGYVLNPNVNLTYYKDVGKIYKEHGVTLKYISSDSIILTDRNFFKCIDFIASENDSHPSSIYGYCYALALYCTMFNEKAIDQNNGWLMPWDIPGNTQAEKDEYMRRLKKAVQIVLDAQK